MVPLKCRHGAGLAPGDYINMVLEGQYATVVEKETKHNLMRGEEQEPEGKPSFLVDGSEQVLFDEKPPKHSEKLNPEDINKMIIEDE